ncbi:MAG: DUF1501 domain-containing protein [Planctomycetaceae bacterium]|nr:DUF1501 domain-containing protein [Planctomycetaceae bacterium]
MDPLQQHRLAETRRHFFTQGSLGLGTAALASLTGGRSLAGPSDTPAASGGSLATGEVPAYLNKYAPKAKRAIWLFMAGAPCQQDMFDYKPKMEGMFDKDLPESIRNGQRLTTMTSGQKRFPIAPSKFKFEQYGKSGAWISELLPHTAKMADDLCIVRSMHTEAINHDPAITYITTGSQLPGRPSLGAWLSYGLGTLNKDLPSFMVMTPTWSGKQGAQALYNRLWGAGFLPSRLSGVALRRTGDPVLYLSNPDGVSPAARRRMLDRLAEMNQQTLDRLGDPETQTRIAQYEMAFKMQTSMPDLMNITGEPKHVLEMYGPEATKQGTFAASCLLARRMLERDVRFVQIFHRGWDQHGNVAGALPGQCRDIDQPSWALVQDLKERGLLEDTLVIWGGEFGRTVYCQGKLSRENYGRDHHPRCFTIWMAGAGIKPGMVYGATDDFSYNITENPVHIHDLNATILQQLGIDHERLTARFQGRDFRLTDVHGEIIEDILA